jgi:Flp pilus assembly protein protease CpaA
MSDILGATAAATVAAIGAGIDLRTGRIPNALTGAAALAGLVLAATGMTHVTLGAALAGGALGLALMLPGHVLGATGAGDAKLLAALGTLLGPGSVVTAFLFTAIFGGVLAMAHAWRRGRVTVTLARTAGLVTAPAAMKRQVDAAAPLTRFAYGPAIALGALVVALWY